MPGDLVAVRLDLLQVRQRQVAGLADPAGHRVEGAVQAGSFHRLFGRQLIGVRVVECERHRHRVGCRVAYSSEGSHQQPRHQQGRADERGR